MLDQLGQLQRIVDNRYYAGERSEMTRIAAWSKAALIRDIGFAGDAGSRAGGLRCLGLLTLLE